MRKRFLGCLGWLGGLSDRLLISARITIVRFMSSSPESSGSGLTAWSLLGILSLPLSPCPPYLVCMCALSLALKNKYIFFFKERDSSILPS